MGKKGSGSSWLTAVKRAFRSSPSKDSDKKPAVRLPDEQRPQDEEKKREKRRWLFRKRSSPTSDPPAPSPAPEPSPEPPITAAVAPLSSARDKNAAIVIQTAFRGYLARRALRALRGLVKLQALVRGHNVRRQATMTLRCIQALVRVQTRVRDQRLRLLSLESSNSSFVSEARFPPDPSLSDRRSMSSVADEWDEQDEIHAMKREKDRALAYALSNQVWRSDRNLTVSDQSFTNRARRASTDQRMAPIKTLEIDRYHHSPSTPSPARSRILQVRSASPRLAAPPVYTPRPSSYHHYSAGAAPVPNYMAATESAKAKLRSLSTPRQRPGTPEREIAAPARRRLAFALPDSSFFSERGDLFQSLRSHGNFAGSRSRERNSVEERSLISSSCNESFLGEISPSSTTELRRRRR